MFLSISDECKFELLFLCLLTGSMEKYSLLNVGHRRTGVFKISMEYILHKYRGNFVQKQD